MEKQIDIQVTEQDGQTLITSYADMSGTLAGDGVYTVAAGILPDDFRADYWPGKYAFDATARTAALSGVGRPVEAEPGVSSSDADIDEFIAILEGRAD